MKSAGKRVANSSRAVERIVQLRRGHRAGVEPGVEHRFDPVRRAPALGAVELDVVDEGPVEIELGEVAAGGGTEIGDGPEAHVVAAVGAAPHRDGCAPVPIARQRPVDVVLEPVAEATFADVFRVPADLLVLAEQVGLARRRAREPLRLRPVDEWRAAPPAMWIRVGVVDDAFEPAAGREGVEQRGVGVLHELAGVGGRNGVVEAGCGSDRVEHAETLGGADLAVDLAERRREVHDARAVVERHEIGRDDPERVDTSARIGGSAAGGTRKSNGRS